MSRDTGWKAKVRECQHNFLKWGEYMKRAQTAERKIEQLETALRRVQYYASHEDHKSCEAIANEALEAK